MALSFLGVWQLPVPGFATSEHAGKLQNQHGYGGAFFKGMFTTVLATPCSGPFLGAVFGYTLTQPAIVTYLIFAAVGLGMGLPYLLVGIFPALVKFLPKPGEWMETFENVLGFVLLATVVYLMAITGQKYFIPTFALLVGLWFACWLIGRVPEYAGTGKVVSTWGVATLVIVAVAYGSFTLLSPVRELYEWKPYNQQTLAALQKEGKTVMLDFTADWCATCRWNFRTAINTSRVKEVVEQNGVVSVKADWTDFSEEIQQKLRELESNSIPLLAIFPAGKPDEPILLRDAVVESQVIAALEKAGPSRAASGTEASTAMRVRVRGEPRQ
jgi:thiol:disulfide interchange protein